MRTLFLLLATVTLGSAVSLQAAFPNLGELTDKLKKVEGTASKVGKVVKGATGLTLDEEIAVGDAVALEIVSRYGGLWRDDAATVRVNTLGRALAKYADRQDLTCALACSLRTRSTPFPPRAAGSSSPADSTNNWIRMTGWPACSATRSSTSTGVMR